MCETLLSTSCGFAALGTHYSHFIDEETEA